MDCLDQLLKSYVFKQQCELTNDILKQISTDSINSEESLLEKFNNFPLAPLQAAELDRMKIELIQNEYKIDSEPTPSISDSNEFPENSTNESWQFSDVKDDDEEDDVVEDDEIEDQMNLSDRVQNKTPKSQILINHMKLMDGDKCTISTLTCNICTKTLPSMLSLARHLNTHSETGIIQLNCTICNRSFSDPGNLTKHINRHKGNPQFNCNICNKQFYELHPLALHMKKKHEVEPTKCKDCGLNLYHPLQHERHERLHAQKICNVCGKICKTTKLLKRHKSSHSTDRPFNCDICDKSFKFNFEVTKHKKICHSGPQPREICDLCGKSILCRSLQAHLRSHDKGTFYKCDYCEKGYYCQETLKQHVKHKHTNKDCHYKLLCSICGRKVISPKDLKIHMMSHTQEKSYQCQQCDKRYKTPGALLTHVRYTHEDKRPFPCNVCFKAFHTKVILQNHMRTHTGERPFSCTVCGRAFGSKSILKTHMKTHDMK